MKPKTSVPFNGKGREDATNLGDFFEFESFYTLKRVELSDSRRARRICEKGPSHGGGGHQLSVG